MSLKRKHRGVHVIVDGIDGSGKGTLILALEKWAKKHGLKIFNVVDYEKTHHTIPEFRQIKSFDVIVCAEPTHSLIGRAIREELVNKHRKDYTPEALAHAYALDRFVLYSRIHVPALRAGKYIFQERGVTSSIAYQPIHARGLTIKDIMDIDGNKFALQHRPDMLCILKINPSVALHRLHVRRKKDQAVFENRVFLSRVQKRFLSPWFRQLFEKRGSRVEVLDTRGSLADTTNRMIEMWERFIASKR
ncbi:MAG: hypothetical protein A2898_04935 [Candidatus Kerfeldbacteria bacterium RIFCSPLOWO2_01_FULL_48_11]|uniref:Thymidylate kinase n=1 Tax=Candidatus Kerfeldbacteria bacterium RIFCSPLOWO2_01_FULL_48_11 TaxID=1798543 RepID=A0A1G2B3U4_9BACT|nr:MAG: Thymidylate kinase [Parcubacteria group bacterium GW2011_GWA2_48_9]KKW15668.1 MAG: Thymidylate kinase [Parcubacteria group bacterium GW2011_GWC2_49_9]OGY82897.1 MAG: hypothetical protein A2898_04935 [Candidatus Kerfeldbacteria bacterium RIFCSPLOWO2_01_FULL_48_11]HCJ52793.1 hypothetical protein [Candidatus Kerfeldbacteria bacterium]